MPLRVVRGRPPAFLRSGVDNAPGGHRARVVGDQAWYNEIDIEYIDAGSPWHSG